MADETPSVQAHEDSAPATALTAQSAQRRKLQILLVASIGIVIIGLAAGIWWRFLRESTTEIASPSPIQTANLPIRPAGPSESLILVADFVDKSNGSRRGIDPAQDVYDALRNRVEQDQLAVRIERLHKALPTDDPEIIQQTGQTYSATTVIVGFYDANRVKAQLEGIQQTFAFGSIEEYNRLTLAFLASAEFHIDLSLDGLTKYLVLVTLGYDQLKTNHSYHAVEYFDAALDLPEASSATSKSINPWAAHFLRAYSYHYQGNDALAIADYTQVIALQPTDPQAYNNRGVSYHAQEEYDLAIADYTQALELQPNDAKVYYNRGLSYAAQEQYALAIADYTQAIKLQPNNADAYNDRSLSYGRQGNNELALADANQAITLQPEYADAYNNRGIHYYNQGNYDLAMADYTQAIKLYPDFATAYYNRGLIYSNQDQLDLAITDYTQAITLKPYYVDAYNNRGLIYHAQGNYDLAIADYNLAIELQPDYPQAYYNRALSYEYQRKFLLSIADYTQVIELQPDFSFAYSNRGFLYMQQKEKPKAIADFQQVLRLDSTEEQRSRATTYLQLLGGLIP